MYYPYNKGITVNNFIHQLEYFRKHYHIIPLTESLRMVQQGTSLRNCLAITTDDGFVENYKVIAPILRKYSLPATFFLTWNSIDNNHLIWCDKITILINRLGKSEIYKIANKLSNQRGLPKMLMNEGLMSWSARVFPMQDKEMLSSLLWDFSNIESEADFLINQQPYLTIEQINDLLTNGFEIGAHSLTHPLFNKLSNKELVNEVYTSIYLLENEFNVKINSFAYPFGIRPIKTELENIFQTFHKKGIIALGTKNSNNNFTDTFNWDRDKQEYNILLSLLCFRLLPYLRRIKFYINNFNNKAYDNFY